MEPVRRRCRARQRAPSAARNPLVGSPSSGTLYVADPWNVFAYDLGATEPPIPLRVIFPHPKQVDSELIEGIATAPDGTLAILQNYFVGNDEYCRTVIEPANAGAGIPALGTYPCDPTALTQGEAIARGANGFDLVYRINGGYSIEHLTAGGTISGTLVLPAGAYDSIAGTATGSDYVGDIGGNVLKYGTGATDPNASLAHFVVPGPAAIQALATAPDHTIYVAAGPLGAEYIYAYPQGATAPARTLGPYPNNYITAMAVDAQNQLYVALYTLQGGANELRVYAADANGKPPPLRRLTEVVPISLRDHGPGDLAAVARAGRVPSADSASFAIVFHSAAVTGCTESRCPLRSSSIPSSLRTARSSSSESRRGKRRTKPTSTHHQRGSSRGDFSS